MQAGNSLRILLIILRLFQVKKYTREKKTLLDIPIHDSFNKINSITLEISTVFEVLLKNSNISKISAAATLK